MHFAFGPEDEELRQAVSGLLSDLCTPAVVRQAWEAPPGELDRTVWNGLVEMGVASILTPVADGGLGLDERSLVGILEEVGRTGVPLPVVESTLISASVLDDEHNGSLVSTDLGGPYIPMAADVDVLILRDDAGILHAVDPGSVTIQPTPSTDRSRRLGQVDWQPEPRTVICDDVERVERAIVNGRFGHAAVIVGLLRRCVDMTVEYVSERQQFGVPIGSFQAVKHHMADAAKSLEFARPAVHRAAWSLAVGHPDASTHVALAKLLTNEAVDVVTANSLQCHGAIGYTVEYDLHLYMKRAWSLATNWGSSSELELELAADLHLPT